MNEIDAANLIINPDGTIFHLHLRPENVADTVIMVGDPARTQMVAYRFSSIEFTAESREFKTITGICNNHRITVLSTGIGTDNIDIVVNELDALVNIDFSNRQPKPEPRSLRLVRLGTSGAIQPDIEIGTQVMATTSIGFDGLLNFYDGRNRVCNTAIEADFVKHMGWNPQKAAPYFIDASPALVSLFSDIATEGITISAPGFYGPQGRVLRLPIDDPAMLEKITSFRYQGRRISNFEMESSAIAGLAALLSHEAVTICTIIAQRAAGKSNANYQQYVDKMIDSALEKLTK